MSYILDALKKAERERGIAKVPTLSTVHDLRTKPPIRLWAASGIVVLCMAAFIWFLFFGMDTDDAVPPPLAEGAGNIADRASPQHLEAPARADESSFSTSSSGSHAIPDSEHPREIPAIANEAKVKIADRAGQGQDTGKREEIQSDRATTVPSPDELTRDSTLQELSGRQPQQSEIPAPQAEVAKPSTDEAGEASVSLQEAMEAMNMSILSYSDNKAERLVFINGRKYVEGDTIEGNYLLESITPEGVVLSYKGERAMLRLGRN
jgi:general secretion pathway protein B